MPSYFSRKEDNEEEVKRSTKQKRQSISRIFRNYKETKL
jgi:hypothetical protein